jgi:hypothetical protein
MGFGYLTVGNGVTTGEGEGVVGLGVEGVGLGLVGELPGVTLTLLKRIPRPANISPPTASFFKSIFKHGNKYL